MAIQTECQTSGAIFDTEIRPEAVTLRVRMPFNLDLSEEQASILEANMHNAMELVLAPYFK